MSHTLTKREGTNFLRINQTFFCPFFFARSKAFEAISFETIPDGVSDHWPVVEAQEVVGLRQQFLGVPSGRIHRGKKNEQKIIKIIIS